MGIGTLMPHLLGVLVWDGRASAPIGQHRGGHRASSPLGADAQKLRRLGIGTARITDTN
jgi:hypothetical protein